MRAPPVFCKRDRSVPRSNGDRLYNTVQVGVYHGARVLSRLAVAAHHATTHGLGPPVATNQWRPRAKRGRAVARDQTARLSAGKVLSRVHCDHLDHGCSPRRLKIWVRGEGAVHARKRLWGEMRAAGWVIGGNVGRGEFLPRDILLIGKESQTPACTHLEHLRSRSLQDAPSTRS